MILCPVCGKRNEDKALFCGECGNKFAIPEGAEHDFTRGVMRYAPDGKEEAGAPPVYLTAQAAEAFRVTDEAVPAAKKVSAQAPAVQGMPAAGMPVQKERKTRKKSGSGKTAAIVIMSLIGILVILIIFGIVYLLGG